MHRSLQKHISYGFALIAALVSFGLPGQATAKDTLAALPFRVQEGIDPDLLNIFVDKLINVMHQVGHYEVLNHTDISILKQQQILAQTTCSVEGDEGCDHILGSKLGADFYLQGSARLVGTNYFLSAKINAVQTGSVQEAGDIVVDPSQPAAIITSAELLAYKLLGIPAPKKEGDDAPPVVAQKPAPAKTEPAVATKETKAAPAAAAEEPAPAVAEEEEPYRYPGGFLMQFDALGLLGQSAGGVGVNLGWDDRWGRVTTYLSVSDFWSGPYIDLHMGYGFALSLRRFLRRDMTFDLKVIPSGEISFGDLSNGLQMGGGAAVTVEEHIGHTFHFRQYYRYSSLSAGSLGFGIGFKF